MDTISFSIVIPLYNKEKYIQRTIRSAINQTHENFEILIINDGSTDNSIEKVKEIRDSRIKLYNQINRGVSETRNIGIEKSKNNWIALLDGDDEWQPDFLEKIANAIYINNDCIAYATAYNKKLLKGVLLNKKINNELLPINGVIENYFKALYFLGPIVTSSSVCLNKTLLTTNNLLPLFEVGVKKGEDLDAWTKLALKNKLFYINEPLVIIHEVKESTSHYNKYRYKDSFDYYNWLNYKTHNSKQKKYLSKFVFKKKRHIIKKLLLQLDFIAAFKVIKSYVINLKMILTK